MCDGSFNVAVVMEEGFCMPARLPSFQTCPKGDSCPRNITRRDDDAPEIAKRRMKVSGDPRLRKKKQYCTLYCSFNEPFIFHYYSLNLLLLRGDPPDLSKYATAHIAVLFVQTFDLSR